MTMKYQDVIIQPLFIYIYPRTRHFLRTAVAACANVIMACAYRSRRTTYIIQAGGGEPCCFEKKNKTRGKRRQQTRGSKPYCFGKTERTTSSSVLTSVSSPHRHHADPKNAERLQHLAVCHVVDEETSNIVPAAQRRSQEKKNESKRMHGGRICRPGSGGGLIVRAGAGIGAAGAAAVVELIFLDLGVSASRYRSLPRHGYHLLTKLFTTDGAPHMRHSLIYFELYTIVSIFTPLQ